MLERDFARAKRRTRRNGACLEWTGPEPRRCSVQGRQINPRTLFWAVEHGLAIEAVPELLCGCRNPLCVLPAHMKPQGTPTVRWARVTPDLIYRLFDVHWTQEQINKKLTRVFTSEEEIPIDDDDEIRLGPEDLGD
jgi:hypothetical protein